MQEIQDTGRNAYEDFTDYDLLQFGENNNRYF